MDAGSMNQALIVLEHEVFKVRSETLYLLHQIMKKLDELAARSHHNGGKYQIWKEKIIDLQKATEDKRDVSLRREELLNLQIKGLRVRTHVLIPLVIYLQKKHKREVNG